MISMNQGYAQFKKDKEGTPKLENGKSLKGNFKEDNFSKKSSDSPTKDDQFLIPDPEGAPISNGILMLMIGSAIYLSNRVRKEKKN